MSISFEWEDENQTLLLLTLSNGWTWEEYHAIVNQLVGIMRELDHIVDVIVENTAKIPFPSGAALFQLRKIARITPENLGVVVVVSRNPFVKSINQILMQISPQLRRTIALADVRDEAYAIIEGRRAQRRGDSPVE